MGVIVGSSVGFDDGEGDGLSVGEILGSDDIDGNADGLKVGWDEMVGIRDGDRVSALDGEFVALEGDTVGFMLGWVG